MRPSTPQTEQATTAYEAGSHVRVCAADGSLRAYRGPKFENQEIQP